MLIAGRYSRSYKKQKTHERINDRVRHHAVLRVAQVLDAHITAEDIDISHKLHGKGEKPSLVKFTSQNAITKLYKKRGGLKHVNIADLY